ncbi:CehA/McbA family metallohydrolase [Candidatus Poribacteria bacterium]|nr:CehA/McbA family metallohydrolase [Candidatus Poribacteria bacterium]MBT5532575.1 CehA/McbA family metallohydrolase [Candidatus Poribacteria bacterium]MBT5710059.1 CehA/McbA family metallohydrolase [Candidatus Poribacteria bacterium]MBT7808930.1 CehA/McbA family metallohydrolase [Candidatus Poribacteria bacterium]
MAVSVDNPYRPAGEWLRGNLHGHSTFSDGSELFEDVLADYERRGYDFLAMTDHDIFIDPADYRANTTLTLIPGVEVSRNGPHILQIDATEFIEPDRDRQTVVNAINAQGAFAVMNHPNWGYNFNHCPHEVLEAVDGYAGIEIYNGVIERLAGTPLATDRWDMLLSKGRRVWGFGHDDSHSKIDVELAWNVVRAPENSVSAIVEALRTGSFYASTGVEVTDVVVADGALRVTTSNATRIRFIGQHGIYRQTTDGASASFTLPTDAEDAKGLAYVRAECYGAGGAVAWTQPVFLNADA